MNVKIEYAALSDTTQELHCSLRRVIDYLWDAEEEELPR